MNQHYSSKCVTASTITSPASTSSITNSGFNNTETVYSQIGQPRSATSILDSSDEETTIGLHRYFSGDYQQQLRLSHNESCHSWHTLPLLTHTTCCNDRHCLQMRLMSSDKRQTKDVHLFVAAYPKLAPVPPPFSGKIYAPIDLTIKKESLRTVPNFNTCSAMYQRSLYRAGHSLTQPLDLSAH